MTAKRVKPADRIREVRAYDLGPSDRGYRVLVDRLWPRGVSKAALDLDEWAKELAPSNELRAWFGHVPRRWATFRKRYFRELEAHADAVRALWAKAQRRTLLLIYGARDAEHNNAVALREYLIAHGPAHGRVKR